MSVIIVNYLRLDELPPAISILEKVNDIGGVYISMYDEKKYKEWYENIRFISIYQKWDEFSGTISFREKLKYKKLELEKRIAKGKIIRYIDKNYKEGDLIWFLHESTVLALGNIVSKYKKYYVTLYELDAAQNDKKGKLANICQNACRVIVPEETRAHIIRSFLELKKKPYVIHNKPLVIENNDSLDEKVLDAVKKIQNWKADGTKVYIYSGIFLPERKLDTIIAAFLELPKTKLVFIGRNSYYLEELKEKYPDGFEYIGFFTAPSHLRVVKEADVGILTYVSKNKSINAIFCAPNKIFEYGAFGLPVIGNDIPGLKYVIEGKSIGACFDQDDREAILKAVKDVEVNYDLYKRNIKKYVDEIDVCDEIEKIIS